MAIIKQENKLPNGDILRDKALQDFFENGGNLGGDLTLPKQIWLKNEDTSNALYKDTKVRIVHSQEGVHIQRYDKNNNPTTMTLNWGNTLTTANGYTQLQNGMIMQWGSATIGDTNSNGYADKVITLPIGGMKMYRAFATCMNNSDFFATVYTNAIGWENQLTIMIKNLTFAPNRSCEVGWLLIGY